MGLSHAKPRTAGLSTSFSVHICGAVLYRSQPQEEQELLLSEAEPVSEGQQVQAAHAQLCHST